MNDEVYKLAKTVWNYHRVPDQLQKADLIFGFGSPDIRTAEYCAELYLESYAPKILFSGGDAHNDDLLKTPWEGAEAVVFAEKAMALGVPRDDILIEDKATNTGENLRFGYQLLLENNLKPKSIILVHYPTLMRRTYTSFKKQWPGEEADIILNCIDTSFDEYIWEQHEHERDRIINTMVGELQRIKEYPKLGYQIVQEIPEHVWDAFENLVEMGYNKHLLS